MKFTHTQRKQTASFRMVGSMLAIAPLWLMLAAANTSAYAETSDNVSKASATTTPAPSPADWTQFHRDNMQRWNPDETVLGVGNVGGLQLKWKSPIGTGQDESNLESSPAVVNGVVYVGSETSVPGGTTGLVYALNASTGAQLWSSGGFDPNSAQLIFASPAVANGVVYISDAVGDIFLSALNASTGALLWTAGTGNTNSSPAVVNGVVYAGGTELGPDNETDFYAFNTSGFGHPCSLCGNGLWSTLIGLTDSSPAVVNGVVYVGCGNSLCALNASTGAVLWTFATGNTVDSSPAVANGVVYIGSDDNNVYALNASTGAKLWSYTTGGGVQSSPAVANGVVYVGSNDNNVYALNASTGVKLWSYTTGNAISYSSPAVANGVMYIGSEDNNVYALNASTGAKLWSYDIGAFSSSPTIVDGVLYTHTGGASGGNVYAFSVGSGSADLFLRIIPTTTTVHQGDLITYAFPVWNLGPDNANLEVLKTHVPAGTVFDYIRISGTPGLGTCSYTPYLRAGPIPIVCHENGAMASNTTWTVRLTVKVTAPASTVITENAATMADTFDPNMANNTATVSLTVVP